MLSLVGIFASYCDIRKAGDTEWFSEPFCGCLSAFPALTTVALL